MASGLRRRTGKCNAMQHRIDVSPSLRVPSLRVSAPRRREARPVKTKDITKIQATEKRIKVTCNWEFLNSRSQVQMLTCPHYPAMSQRNKKRPPTPRNVFVVRGGTTQQQLVGKRETNRRDGGTRRGGNRHATPIESAFTASIGSTTSLTCITLRLLSWLRGRPTSHPRTPRLGIPSTTIVS